MNRVTTPILILCALALFAAPALGGPLATAPGVYFDGFTTWHGSSPFQGYFDPPFNTQPSGLSGTIDWAVWAPGTFPAGFSGYTPTPGEFVYTYQVNVDGPDPLSQSIVLPFNQADNIGSFSGDAGFGSVTGDFPFSSVIIPFDSAQWTFVPGVDGGESTSGLAFSSLYTPVMSAGVEIDGGTFALTMVPAPNGPLIPEPGTMALASCGFGVLAVYWLRRRSRRTV